MGKRRVLLVDPPAGPLRALADSLERNGCAVFVAEGARDALEQAMETLPDVVVVSRQCEEADLLDLCRSLLRNLGEASPAILIAPAAAQDSEPDTASGMAQSLAQSMALDLLAQSVRTLTFRSKVDDAAATVFECHDIRLDPQTGVATLAGKLLDLTPTEFRVLQALVAQPGLVLTRQQLEEVLGSTPAPATPQAKPDSASEARKRRIDVHIKAIRGKLADRGSLIETVRGVGYRLREPDWDAS